MKEDLLEVLQLGAICAFYVFVFALGVIFFPLVIAWALIAQGKEGK